VALAIRPTIIVATATSRNETGGPVKCDRRVSVAYLKVKALGACSAGCIDEVPQKALANSTSLPFRVDRDQQQFRFVGDDSGQRKGDGAVNVLSDGQDHTGHRQDPGALRARPAFAEAGLESLPHDPHYFIEIVDPARPKPEVRGRRSGFRGHQAAALGLASGARA